MIERNGWCYADDPAPGLAIIAAEYLGGHRLRVRFNDGAERIFDGHELLVGEVFAPLADEQEFKAYALDYETLTWMGGELDVAPEFVYEHSRQA